jgi:hypothetical protein
MESNNYSNNEDNIITKNKSTKYIKEYIKEYDYIYVPYKKSKKSKNNPCNEINKHVNKYNKKNDKYYNPDAVYLKGFKYITNSDVYFAN